MCDMECTVTSLWHTAKLKNEYHYCGQVIFIKKTNCLFRVIESGLSVAETYLWHLFHGKLKDHTNTLMGNEKLLVTFVG